MKHFENFSDAEKMIREFDLEPISLPRQRCPPKRLTGNAENYYASSPIEHHRRQYFSMIDTAIIQLKDRIYQKGMDNLICLEKILLTGEINNAIKRYEEINYDKLKIQLLLFKTQFEYKTLNEAADKMRKMTIEVSINNIRLKNVYSTHVNYNLYKKCSKFDLQYI